MTKEKNERRSLDDYDREVEHRLRRRRLHALAEAACGIALLLAMWGFCWLCCAVSGYHWE